jgi:Tfp pilus assembly protein PilN
VRPVNLIPPEERRDRAAVRTGPIAYMLVGALALALGAVTLTVLTNNKISDRKAEIGSLRQQEVAAKARAAQLAPFAEFNKVEEQRAQTITSLADSRFDWERVMRELARVIPSDVWLTDLNGAVSSAVANGATSSTTASTPIDAPSLTLSGCAAGQDAVAGFLAALRDIDGVTRVGLTSSEKPTGGQSTTGSSGSGGGDTECRTRDFITKFEIVAAFDAVPTPEIPGAAPSAPASPAPAPAPSTEATPASDASPTANPGT